MADPLKEHAGKRMERAIDFLIKNEAAIVDAHVVLGLPLEDVLSAAIHRALTVKAADADKQLHLLFAVEK